MIIGVDVGGTKITAGVVKGGKVLTTTTLWTESKKGKAAVINNILLAIEKVFDKRVKGIGIGFPSPVVDGVVYNESNIKSFYNVNLKKIVQKKFKKKVVIDNDANCFAIAEKKFGKCKKYKNICGVTLGTGIGIGIIINKQLHRGATGCAGEYSQIPLLDRTLDDFASREMKALIKKHGLTGSAKDVSELARKNKKAKRVFEKYGERVGVVLSVVANTIDPEIIVIGGSISKSYNLFKNGMMNSFKKNIYKHTAKKIKVEVSKLEDAGVVGAAGLVE